MILEHILMIYCFDLPYPYLQSLVVLYVLYFVYLLYSRQINYMIEDIVYLSDVIHFVFTFFFFSEFAAIEIKESALPLKFFFFQSQSPPLPSPRTHTQSWHDPKQIFLCKQIHAYPTQLTFSYTLILTFLFFFF